mgnify:CR=1 FL=1
MEAIKEILHVTHNTLQIRVPPAFNDQDVAVIILPTSREKEQRSFNPSEFYGITNRPESDILPDAGKLRNEWERGA